VLCYLNVTKKCLIAIFVFCIEALSALLLMLLAFFVHIVLNHYLLAFFVHIVLNHYLLAFFVHIVLNHYLFVR